MKPVFTFLLSSLLAGSAVAQTAQAPRPLSDICRIRFKMDDRTLQTCNSGSTPTRNGSYITLLGKRIADGIYWERNPISAGSTEYNVWAKNGTTIPPTGALFNDCSGNWVYFKASGFNYFARANDSKELINIHIRVKAFGNERNPDSLRVEFARNTDVRPEKLFNSAKKDTICQDFQCVLPDYTAPYITNCVQNEKIIYPLAQNVTTISSADIMAFNHLDAIDDCSVADIRTYPYKLHNVTNGQLVDYHTVAYDSTGNQSICRFKVQFLSPANDTCLTSFSLRHRATPTCTGASSTARSTYSITLLGKKIADGIRIHRSPMTAGGTTYQLFARNGSVTPAPNSRFMQCSGHWTYFTMSGWAKSTRSHYSAEVTNKHVRVKNFGNEANPDSLQVEFAQGDELFGGDRFFNTGIKDMHCNQCQASDKMAPVIRNCPTQLIKYPVPNPDFVKGDDLELLAKITATDNCKLNDMTTYPALLQNPKKGQIINFHTVAYDESANKSVCNFKVELIAAPCSVYEKPSLSGLYETDQTITAGAGQICAVATWKQPTLFHNPSFNPVKITSNYPSGHCFPIGTTHVLYTAKDSCGKVDTAGFYITVKSFSTPDMSVNLTTDTTQYFVGQVVKYKITVKNVSGATFSNVKIKFPFPAHTALVGNVVPSVGTWNETCATNLKCYEWTIPTLNVHQTATMLVPLRLLTADVAVETKAQLIASTPADKEIPNNSAMMSLYVWRIYPTLARESADNQNVTLDIKSLSPNPTDGALLLRLKSIVEKDVTFDFYNAIGAKVHSQTQKVQNGENELFFDVAKLPTGVYFLQTSELGDQKSATKFVKY